jgi:hypothetical protein
MYEVESVTGPRTGKRTVTVVFVQISWFGEEWRYNENFSTRSNTLASVASLRRLKIVTI